MSTEILNISCIRDNETTVVRFYGGRTEGTMYQIAQDTGYIQLSADELDVISRVVNNDYDSKGEEDVYCNL